MGKAWIDGAEAPLEEAIAAAADLISRSRQPLITGLATDVAGVKASLGLARLCDGIVDHGGSDVLYRNIEVLRTAGMFVAAPAEMRRRADRFLIVGGDAADLAPELLAFVFGGDRDLGRDPEDGAERTIVWLGGEASDRLKTKGIAVEAYACAPEDLADALAMVRASLAGRRFGEGPIAADKASGIAAWLGGAAFACVIWSAASLDALGVEMASGLVGDLNLRTRASSIPLSGRGQAWGAAQIATSVSGFPLRTRFADGEAHHDAWAYSATRLVASRECDLVVHVSALGGEAFGVADLSTSIPVVAITDGASAPDGAAVAFSVGRPGHDHAGVLYREEAGSFVPVEAPSGETAISAAEVLQAIAAALGDAPAKRAA